MFGWIHESFRQLVTTKYGRPTWLRILELANFNDGDECYIRHYYEDEETFRLGNAMAVVLGVSLDDVWEAYGGFLIHYTMQTGWDDLLRAMASSLEEFLDGLDSLHYFVDHALYGQNLKGPSFRSEQLSEGSLLLHYYSRRSGLHPIVKGVVREVARVIFGLEVMMKITGQREEKFGDLVAYHATFIVKQAEGNVDLGLSITSRAAINLEKEASKEFCGMTMKDFAKAFPFHICVNKELIVEHIGNQMLKLCPWIEFQKTHLTEIIESLHPQVPLTFQSILAFKNTAFITRLKNCNNEDSDKEILLKGAMVLTEHNNYVMYLCSLNATTIRELNEQKLFVSDMQLHDGMRELILLNQTGLAQVALNKMLEEATYTMRHMGIQLATEKKKTDDLLSELMPATVVEALRQGRPVEACEFPRVTVLFTDIVTFTNMCALCTPYDVVMLLNDLYVRFDRIIAIHKVYKVETIGDAYVIGGGVPISQEDDAERVLNAAIGLLMESKMVRNPVDNQPIRLRIGVHTGEIVAGVVGIKSPKYCLFGDTVSIANKMESHSLPCKIHVSKMTKKAAEQTNQHFEFINRGMIEIKGKGIMNTFFLEKNEMKSVWEICDRERGNDQSIDGYVELHDTTAYLDPTIIKKNEWKLLKMVLLVKRNFESKEEINAKTDERKNELKKEIKKSDVCDSVFCVLL